MSNKTILYIIFVVFSYLGWGIAGLILDGKFEMIPTDFLIIMIGYAVITISGEKDEKSDGTEY